MYAAGEYHHLIFPQKLSYSDYFFVYAGGNNIVVGSIQTTF